MLIDFTWLDRGKNDDPHPDEAGFLILINELFETRPELFGTEAQRNAFAKECQSTAYQDNGQPNLQRLIDDMPALFEKHSINPLSTIDAVFVAPCKLVCQVHQKLIGLFHHFQIIPEKSFLTRQNAHHLASSLKADFLISGNVLNAPVDYPQADTMLACAMMLKQGGAAIHLLSHGEDFIFSRAHHPIASPTVHAQCGQTHLRNIPPGAYTPSGKTFAMLLRQVHEIPYEIEPSEPPKPLVENTMSGGTIGNGTKKEPRHSQ